MPSTVRCGDGWPAFICGCEPIGNWPGVPIAICGPDCGASSGGAPYGYCACCGVLYAMPGPAAAIGVGVGARAAIGSTSAGRCVLGLPPGGGFGGLLCGCCVDGRGCPAAAAGCG